MKRCEIEWILFNMHVEKKRIHALASGVWKKVRDAMRHEMNFILQNVHQNAVKRCCFDLNM